MLKGILKFFIFLSIGLTILVLVYKNNQSSYEAECILKGIALEDCSLLDKVISDFKNVSFRWIFIVAVLFMASNIFRALRWDMLLRSLGYKTRIFNLFGTVMLGYFANLGIPRSGEVIRAATLSKYEDIPVEKVMGTIVVDRIMDVLSLLVVIIIAVLCSGNLILDYFSQNAEFALIEFFYHPLFWIAVGLGILLVFLLYRFWDRLTASSIGQKLANIISGFYDGIMSVKKVNNVSTFLLYSIGIWLCYYLMTYLCFFAYDPTSHLGPLEGLIVFVFGTFGMVIPAPGGMGSYQFLVNESLNLFGINPADGFSFANIIFFSISIFCNVIFGIICLITLPIFNRQKKKV